VLLKKSVDIPSSEITPRETYFNRRNFLTGAVITGAAVATGVVFRDLYRRGLLSHRQIHTLP
jgi:hypothetical protein